MEKNWPLTKKTLYSSNSSFGHLIRSKNGMEKDIHTNRDSKILPISILSNGHHNTVHYINFADNNKL